MDMKASRFTENADRRDFARAGGRAKTGDVCRKQRISTATFYEWKAKYGGLEVSNARKALEDENAMLKDAASKNGDARSQSGKPSLTCAANLR
jgi:putative transposase